MNNNIFISYSTVDSRYAYRIYYDLTRSGFNVYLYEKNGEVGINFRNEIYQSIEKSNIFLLIDSPYSRKSSWVKEECHFAYNLFYNVKNQNNHKDGCDVARKIIPCFVTSADELLLCDELVPQQAELRGMDFSGIDNYDYLEKYKKAINELCSLCGKEYSPWSEIPRSRDFEKELENTKEIKEDLKLMLKRDYENFVFCSNRDLIIAKDRIKIIVKECEQLNIKVISVYLALGSILVDSNQFEKANAIYTKIVELFPKDSRSWAAKSAAEFYSNQFEDSLNSISKSIAIIESDTKNPYLQAHYAEMINKKIQIFIALDRITEAKSLLLIIKDKDQFKDIPEFIISEIKLEMYNENPNIENCYQKLSTNYYTFHINSKSLNSYIADLESTLGRRNVEKFKNFDAVKHYTLACEADPQNIQYNADLCLLLYSVYSNSLRKYLDLGLVLKPNSEYEYYYYGLLKYLNSEKEIAKTYFLKSRKHNWPYYDSLIISK